MWGRSGSDESVGSVHSEPLRTMGRRRFLDTLTAAGFSAGMAACLTADDFEAADDDEVPIVYGIGHDPDDPTTLTERVRTVPARWYDMLQAAYTARQNLSFIDIEGVVSTYVVPGSYDRPTPSIGVDVVDDAVRDLIPDLTGEIPIDVSSIEDAILPDAEEPDSYHVVDVEREVPGGIACTNGSGVATLTPALYDASTGAAYFATARHLYERDAGSLMSRSLSLMMKEGIAELGKIKAVHDREDVLVVRPGTGFEPLNEIAGATPSTVSGQFTRPGLADLLARDANVEKVGATTRHTAGKLHAIDAVTCIYGDPCNSAQIKWGNESIFSDGDSGSVSYHPDPDNPDENVMVVGFNNARTWWPGENYVWGTAAYALYNRFGYIF